MEVNRKGWTAQCVDIRGRSLQGDGKEGEVVVHTTLQPPQRALTPWWPRLPVPPPVQLLMVASHTLEGHFIYRHG